MFIDTHAHINVSNYNNLKQVVDSFQKERVLKVINCSEDLVSSKEITELSFEFNKILYPAIGIHPLNVTDIKENDIKEIEKLIKKYKIIAIGEIGLDYHYSKDTIKIQQLYFRKQLDLAQKYKLPAIIHSRNATEDTINILKEYKIKGVIHCFNDSIEIANKYIEMGFYLGIGGIVTFKNSKLKNVVKKIPLNKILLETDSPFLTPEPYRKYKNEPKYIPIIAKFISQIKEIPLKEIERVTTQNANALFDIYYKK